MYERNDRTLTHTELESLLKKVDGARIGLIGDLCLDMYWESDMRLSELSRETPHYPLPIVAERYAPGGAGNVASNLAALRPGHLAVVGLAGTDWRGDLLVKALAECGVDGQYVVREPGLMTNTYIKPLRRGISDVVYEDPRLDFENRKPLSPDCERKVLAALDEAALELDVICVSDQMKYGCVTPAVRTRLCELGRTGKTVIVDSRNNVAAYCDVTVKPNEVEAVRAFGKGGELGLPELADLARDIVARNHCVTLMTLGSQGCFVADEKRIVLCPACEVEPPIDFCGAGDAFLAGYGALLAGGATPLQAAQIATLCSAVTIKKIGTTGTAMREEVLAAWETYIKNRGGAHGKL